jgi:hypothetical protein
MHKVLRNIILATSMTAVTVGVVGCTQADVDKTVALIESQIPTAIALTNTVIAAYSAFGAAAPDNSAAASVGAVVTNDLAELQQLCAQYTAQPNKNAFQSIVNLVDKLVTEGDTALLDAAAIKNVQTRSSVTAAIGALDTILHVVDGYVQSTQSTAQVKATAQRRQVKLRQISMYLDLPIIGHAIDAKSTNPIQLGEAAIVIAEQKGF